MRKMRNIGRIVLSLSCLSLSPSAWAQNSKKSSEQPKHFYIYDECYLPVSSTVTLVASGATTPTTSSTSVLPGSQTLVGTTYGNSVKTHSVSQDGILHWSTQTFSLTDLEYTHVITCTCPTNNSCPQQWPSPKSRQMPNNTSAKKSSKKSKK
jgi:hypothetical protein